MASKSLRKVSRTQEIGQDRLITRQDKLDTESHDHEKIIERIRESYTGLCESEQSTIIHIHPKKGTRDNTMVGESSNKRYED